MAFIEAINKKDVFQKAEEYNSKLLEENKVSRIAENLRAIEELKSRILKLENYNITISKAKCVEDISEMLKKERY